MKTKSNLLLLTLFAFSVGIVSWFGFQLVQQQSQKVKLSQINSSEQALVLMQENLNKYVRNYSSNLHRLIELESNNLEAAVNNNASIHEVMVFDIKDQLIYTSNESVDKHRQALGWMQSISSPIENNEAGDINQGWLTWYDGQKEKYIYWAQNSNRKLFVELNNSMFKAELIYWLSSQPDITTQVSNRSSRTNNEMSVECCLLKITDNLNRVFYQWGDSKTEGIAEIIIQKDLAEPLSGWSLKYFSKLESLDSISKTFFQTIIIAIIVLLSLITLILFKIRRKEQMEAQQKLSFINQVSHELKTPLTNIRLHGDLLERSIMQVNLKKESLQSLAIIQQESERLTRLINNVLNFNSVEKKSLKLNGSLVDFEELLKQAILPFEPTFKSLNIQVVTNNQKLGKVNLDVDVFKQIIGNLMSNVEKYAPKSKRVTIETKYVKTGNMISLVFKDQGPGIQKKDSEKVFQAFYRVDSSLKSAAGSGLGLALARDLARLHGGDLVLVDSQQGACFKLTLEIGNA
jgi:signal transduction histidine kinase